MKGAEPVKVRTAGVIEEVHVELGERSYGILIGEDLLGGVGETASRPRAGGADLPRLHPPRLRALRGGGPGIPRRGRLRRHRRRRSRRRGVEGPGKSWKNSTTSPSPPASTGVPRSSPSAAASSGTSRASPPPPTCAAWTSSRSRRPSSPRSTAASAGRSPSIIRGERT